MAVWAKLSPPFYPTAKIKTAMTDIDRKKAAGKKTFGDPIESGVSVTYVWIPGVLLCVMCELSNFPTALQELRVIAVI